MDKLEGTSLRDALEQLAADEATGVLRVGDSSEVWLSQGRVYFAATPTSNDLALVLVASGLVEEAEAHALLAQAKASGSYDVASQLAALGKATVSAGTEEVVLKRLLHEHNLSVFFELVVPADWSFEFVEEQHELGSYFSEPVDLLLEQAEHRLEIWTKIASRIPSTALVFQMVPELPIVTEVVISPDQWRYLALLDGRSSVAQLIGATGESAFRVCSALYRLLLEGLVQEV